MVSVPKFLLRKLYVKGTLQSTGQAVTFRLRNTLGSGYAEEMLPISFDGEDMPMESCFFSSEGESRCFDQVSKAEPFCLLMNRETIITVKNVNLTQEAHTIGMGFRVPGLGMLRFDFVDLPSSGSKSEGPV
ncbi:MAG: hypothetical protein IH962_00695 [Chloroflexi bacterium]|nr:hypothetical protein [Chloroflexota bacterium]